MDKISISFSSNPIFTFPLIIAIVAGTDPLSRTASIEALATSKFLGYGVRKLLLTNMGGYKETDRDSYSYKRIDLAGSLLLELFRELWATFQRNVSLTIDKEYKFNIKQYGNDITNIINEDNTKKIFNIKVMETLEKSFGAVFGTALSGRQGIVQDLNRLSMLGALSHIRRFFCY